MRKRIALLAACTLAALGITAAPAAAHPPVAGKQPTGQPALTVPPRLSVKMPRHYPDSGGARYTGYQWGWAHCGYGGWTCDTSVSPVVGTEDWGVVGDHSRQIYVRWYERASYRRKCYAVLRVDHSYVVAQIYYYDCVRV